MHRYVTLLGQIPDFETEKGVQSYCDGLCLPLYSAFPEKQKPMYELNAENLRALIRFGPSWQGKTIADLGCGAGLFTKVFFEFCPSKVIGIDQSRAMIQKAQKTPLEGIEYRIGKIEDLRTVIPEGADIAIAHGTMGYVENLAATCSAISCTLRSSGAFLFEIGIDTSFADFLREQMQYASKCTGITHPREPPNIPPYRISLDKLHQILHIVGFHDVKIKKRESFIKIEDVVFKHLALCFEAWEHDNNYSSWFVRNFFYPHDMDASPEIQKAREIIQKMYAKYTENEYTFLESVAVVATKK